MHRARCGGSHDAQRSRSDTSRVPDMPSPLQQIPASAWWVTYVLMCLGLVVSFATPVATGRFRGAVVVLLLIAAVMLAAAILYRKSRWFSSSAALIALVTALGVFSWATQSQASPGISPTPPTGNAILTGVATGSATTPPSSKSCIVSSPVPSPTGPNFEICMLVKGADGQQKRDVASIPFGVVRVLVEYKNTGASVQKNVVVKAKLPAGFSLIPRTTRLINSAAQEGIRASEDLSKVGINLGNYAPNGNAFLLFDVLGAEPQAFKCGESRGLLIIDTETDNGTKSANSVLSLVRECPS